MDPRDHLTEAQIRFLNAFVHPVPTGAAPDPHSEISAGIVKKRGYLITRRKQLDAEFRAESNALMAAVARELPYENPTELGAAILARVNDLVGELISDLNDAIDTDINTGDGTYAALNAAVGGLTARVSQHPVIQALKNNGLAGGDRFEPIFTTALEDIRAHLTA